MILECPRCRVKLKKGAERCGKCGARPRRMLEQVGKSSIGMEENVAAASANSFLFLSGLFFLLIERKSAFVRFYALQGAVSQLVIIFLLMISIIYVPGLGPILALLLLALNLFVIVTLFLKAMAGEWLALPLIGGPAERWARVRER